MAPDDCVKSGHMAKGVKFLSNTFLILKGLSLFLLAASLCLYGAPIQIFSFFISFLSFSLYHNYQNILLEMQYCFMQFTFEKIQGAHITYSGDNLEAEESAIVFSNHQSSADLFMIGALSTKLDMSGCSRYFMKDSIKYIPIFGWGLWLTGQFFLKRNWAEDKKLINRTFERIIRYKLPVWIISYPEGTRITPSKKKESDEFSESRGLKPFENVLYPRTKGLVATIQALRESHIRYVYDVTIAYCEGSSPEGFGKTLGAFQHYYVSSLSPRYQYHVHVDKFLIDELPTDDKQLSEWLIERFRRKDRLLESLKFHKWTGILPESYNIRDSPL